MREKIRDQVDEPVTLDYFQKRWAEGWRVSAIEWHRDVVSKSGTVESEPTAYSGPPPHTSESSEIPDGVRISADCSRLEANPDEMAVMMVMLQEIVKDQPFSLIAGLLNRQRLKTRNGRDWTSADVFGLMPRLIDAGPQLLKSSEWPARRLEVLRHRVI
jgi:hypothetical protein